MTKNNQTFKPTKKQRDVVEMLIYSGKTQRRIALELGMDETTISKWLNKHDEFQAYYNQELEKAKNYRQQKYKRYAQRAVDRLIYLLDAENENVQLASAKEILDRAGDKVDDNVNVNVDIERSTNLINSIAEQVGIGVGKDE
jgi:Sigma-70, region 4.